MSIMGVKINQFEYPVCNSFRPKIVLDQLCYQVDPNKYKDKIDLNQELSLTLFIHYNEDRNIDAPEYSSNEDPFIKVDSIGTYNSFSFVSYTLFRAFEIISGERISTKCCKRSDSHRLISIIGQESWKMSTRKL